MPKKVDLAVIGGGPGGYVAALSCAEGGMKTAVIDSRATLGGTCLNIGCIPSKALLHASHRWSDLLHGFSKLGIEAENPKFHLPETMQFKDKVVASLVGGVDFLFRKDKVEFIHGQASFVSPQELLIKTEHGEEQLQADKILIATGSEPVALPFLPFDEKQILSSTGALSLSTVPESMVIIGGGVIGAEMGSIYARLGTKVTIIEMLPQLCTGMDSLICKQMLSFLTKQGLTCHLNSTVVSAVLQPDEVILTVKIGDTLQNISTKKVLVAVGRRPFTSGLNLDKIGITLQKGFIPVNNNFRTAMLNIYAIGDVIQGAMLAHRASAEARALAAHFQGKVTPVNYMAVPNIIYTYPEAASVGLTEDEARAAGIELFVGQSFFKANARARCMDEAEGVVKILGDKKSGKVIGLHIVGPEASELINIGALAIQAGATIEDVALTPFGHPTLGESLQEAAALL